jgi:hypothetical protein
MEHPTSDVTELLAEPDTPYLSETSDFEHDGNGIPCRFYNHDGCKRGTACKFKHGPDHRSVRDNLCVLAFVEVAVETDEARYSGRNVCLFYLLDLCKFSASQCVYAHDKKHLPAGPWDEPDWKSKYRTMLAPTGVQRSAELLEQLAPMVKPTQQLRPESFLPHEMERSVLVAGICYVSSIEREREREYMHARRGMLRGRKGRGKGKGKLRSRWQLAWEDMDSYDDEDIMEQRYQNGGFTDAEVQELLCQGVKPWDDDAWVSPISIIS